VNRHAFATARGRRKHRRSRSGPRPAQGCESEPSRRSRCLRIPRQNVSMASPTSSSAPARTLAWIAASIRQAERNAPATRLGSRPRGVGRTMHEAVRATSSPRERNYRHDHLSADGGVSGPLRRDPGARSAVQANRWPLAAGADTSGRKRPLRTARWVSLRTPAIGAHFGPS